MTDTLKFHGHEIDYNTFMSMITKTLDILETKAWVPRCPHNETEACIMTAIAEAAEILHKPRAKEAFSCCISQYVYNKVGPGHFFGVAHYNDSLKSRDEAKETVREATYAHL